MRAKEDLRREAVRLRVEERLSLPEIQTITGASRSSLSGWLREHPLSAAELQERRVRNHGGGRPARIAGETPSSHYRTFVSQTATRGDKGRIAEAAVVFRLVLRGIRVFRSLFDGDTVDFVLSGPEAHGRLLKVQVKWATRSPRGGMPVLYLRCANGTRRYADGEFDFLVGYDLYSDVAYVYSAEELSRNAAMVSVSDAFAERWEKITDALRA